MNFKQVFMLLKNWFDSPTPPYQDFSQWRFQTYADLDAGKIKNLPLKTWWPQYSSGDFRLELCLGALLIQQNTWKQVRKSILNLIQYLHVHGNNFDVNGLRSIPLSDLQTLIKPSGFLKQKSQRILKFCSFINDTGMSLDAFFHQKNLGGTLQNLKCGFGDETRDCALLYAANRPVFIASAYARKLLKTLDGREYGYDGCQATFTAGMQRDFTKSDLEAIRNEYSPEEIEYALGNDSREDDISWVLLFQQFQAGIVELGIAKGWEKCRMALSQRPL